MTDTLYIKNMVCNRCIKVVKEELEKLNLSVIAIELGKVTISETLAVDKKIKLRQILNDNGFELIDDKKSQLIERIKTLIIERIHHSNFQSKPENISEYLSRELMHDYSYLSNLFSSVEGITIEKYYIKHKIEKVKELLVYDELTLSEIAYRLGYSSVQHLSNQFKKLTGLSPSHFKQLKSIKRNPLDKI